MSIKTIYKGNSRFMAVLSMVPYLIKDLFEGRKPRFHWYRNRKGVIKWLMMKSPKGNK